MLIEKYLKDSTEHTQGVYITEALLIECSSIGNDVKARMARVIAEKNRADKIQSHHSSHLVYSGHLQAAEAFKLFTGQNCSIELFRSSVLTADTTRNEPLHPPALL